LGAGIYNNVYTFSATCQRQSASGGDQLLAETLLKFLYITPLEKQTNFI